MRIIQEECTDKETGKRKISDYEDDRAIHLCARLVKEHGIVFDEEIRKQGVAKLVEKFSYLRGK